MDVVLSAPRGFCAGVVRAVDVVNLCLQRFGPPVYVRHEIVHNPHVVNELRQKGAVLIERIEDVPLGQIVDLSAHGVAPSVGQEARARGGKNSAKVARLRLLVPPRLMPVYDRLETALEEVYGGTLESKQAQAMASLARAPLPALLSLQ